MPELGLVIAPPPQPPPGAHLVQFYEDDAFIVEEVSAFLADVLRAGGAAIVIATPAHRAALEPRLPRGNGATGELVMLDAREALARFMVGGMPDEALFLASVGAVVARAAQGGRRRVHAFGEMVALLVADGQAEAAVRLEELWNALAERHAFALLCAYPLRLFASTEQADAFRHVCAAHNGVRPTEQARGRASTGDLDAMVAMLQQKAAALESEVARREATEQALRRRERELRETDAERAALLDELRTANRAKDEFLAMLGHELRNPLAPIVTALRLMKMRGDLQSSHEQAVIQRQVDHLVHLVDDLLDVSRIARGMVHLRPEVLEIGQVLSRAVEMAGVLLEQRGHRLDIDVPPTGLLWRGDPTRLAQVVSNLLTNAARYTDPGGHVRLRAWREGGQIEIAVQDNGRGLSPELQPQVFDLFFQGRRGVDRAEGGLGVGLALVKSLVELHGGTVQAHSEGPGRGSEFRVSLPAAPAGAEHGARVARAAGPAGPPRRVLLVDDNVDAAVTLAGLLRASGHHVAVVHDPVQALGMAEAFAPEVAVLDIGLPVMDGYELAGHLRDKAPPGCRLLALTGYGRDVDHLRSRAAGFERHLVKPLDPQALLDALAAD